VRVELQHIAALAGDAEIVDENTNGDATIGGVQHSVSQQVTARVALPNEILDVERYGRLVGQRETRSERELVAIEKPMRGLAVGQHRFDSRAEIGQGAVLRDRRGSLDRRHAGREGSAADEADSRESD
jgi:hypothetical protein